MKAYVSLNIGKNRQRYEFDVYDKLVPNMQIEFIKVIDKYSCNHSDSLLRTNSIMFSIIERAIDITCKVYKVPRKLIFMKSRKKEVVIPRQVLMYVLIRGVPLGLNLTQLGFLFKFTHPTIIHSVKVVENSLKFKNEYIKKEDIDYIVNKLKSEIDDIIIKNNIYFQHENAIK